MKQALQFLLHRGNANMIKILCLGVGMAIGLAMLAEVIFERNYDTFVPQAENTYRLGELYQAEVGKEVRYGQTAGALAPGLKKENPYIEAATRFTPIESGMELLTETNKEIQANSYLCDTAFFDVFPRKILMGEDPHKGLAQANNAYISDKLLEVLGHDILGKTLTWKIFPQFKITVTGVFEALPENTHLPQMDILVAMPTIGQLMWDGSNNWVGNDRYSSYIQLKPGYPIEDFDKQAQQIFISHCPPENLAQVKAAQIRIYSEPIRSIFSSSSYNRIMNIVFLSFALVMLAVSVLNYILLTISSMVNRAKSIATYRCYGAGSANIYKMILFESAFHCVLGLIIAILIIFGLQDFLQKQTGHSLSALFPPATILICAGVVILVLLFCGLVPGYLYTRIPVTYAYRRYTESKRHWKLALLFFQFLLTTFFISILTVIGLEYHTLTNYKTGFAYKDVFYTSVSGIPQVERDRCVEELKKIPNVKEVTWGYQMPNNSCSGNNVYDNETGQAYMNIADMYDVGSDYHKLFDIPIIEGNGFIPDWKDTVTQQAMVSRQFVEKMNQLAGWKDSPIGKTFFLSGHQGPSVICGVYEDIHLGPQIAEQVEERPTVMFYNPQPCYQVFIRLKEMTPEKIQQIQNIVTRTMPSQDKKVYSLGLEMGNMYDSILHVRDSVLFAGICILIIALIGLTAYIRDEVARRRAEIAIRIIHGASVSKIQQLFLKDLLRIAVPATLIGALLAAKIGSRMLQLFAVKISLSWYLFAGCVLVVLIIVLAVSSLLVLKASRMNPTENLRSE